MGYIIGVDNVQIYIAGDTSKTEQMQELKKLKLDYVFLPCDGIYNMDVQQASECAEIIGAKHSIPYHTSPKSLFDENIAQSFIADTRLILKPKQELVI